MQADPTAPAGARALSPQELLLLIPQQFPFRFVDEITAESAQRLHAVSAKAWRQAFKTVMQEAATRHAEDAQNATLADRTHRARFGSYFYAEETPHVPRPAPRA